MKRVESESHIFTPGQVLEEFDFEGRSAKVKVLEPNDMSDQNLNELVSNLTDVNFALLENLVHAKNRAKIRGVIHGIRQRLGEGKIVNALDRLKGRVYPDFSQVEHEKGYQSLYRNMITQGKLVGVIIDGKAVAVQGYMDLGPTQNGRNVYEMMKASTLEAYKGKGLNKKIKMHMYETIIEAVPDAMLVAASRNKSHLNRLQGRGWHRVPMDDSNEAVRLMNGYDAKTGGISDYAKMMMNEQGFETIYFDPKIDGDMF